MMTTERRANDSEMKDTLHRIEETILSMARELHIVGERGVRTEEKVNGICEKLEDYTDIRDSVKNHSDFIGTCKGVMVTGVVGVGGWLLTKIGSLI